MEPALLQSPEIPPAASLEACLKLLRGERDEQRLAGLLLVTKLCNNDDHDSIRRVYDAVGVQFLDRLLRTGMGKRNGSGAANDNQDAYLQLSVTVLAAFCRVPDVAQSEHMVSKIPLMLEVMTKQSASSILQECYEFLFLVPTASGNGITTLFDSGGLEVLAAQISSLPDVGSQVLELCLRLVQLVLSKIPLDAIMSQYPTELSVIVACISRQFALLQNALKFDLLHLLCIILSSDHSAPLHNALRLLSNEKWPAYVRAGIVDILQNRVAADQKLQALVVAKSMVSMLGERWLISQMDLPDIHRSIPTNMCLLLVLESSRVEVAVLLNELAYLKYEASSSNAEAIPIKQRNLAIAFSLVEKIIKLISNIGEDEGCIISESTFTKVITGLNETIEVVLEYLKDAKDHGQTRGDDLLASVRLVGSYLAEAPLASKEKVEGLLGYMLSVEGQDEQSPFLSVCFLLPMLCQATMKTEGVKSLASSGGYKAVVDCLVRLVGADPHAVDDNGCIFLAFDTIMNFFLKREHIRMQLDESVFVHLLKALAYWTESTNETSIIMMAASISSLILEGTSEEALLTHRDFDHDTLQRLSRLIAGSLAACGQETCDDGKSDADLHQIFTSGYSRWADRFPSIRQVVEQ